MPNATVCLCMIVKNEVEVLADCLASVRPLIDRWLIVDTGSSDGTQALIRRSMAGMPGELHERPWRDFGRNRTEAIELTGGHCDYLLFIDADETLERAADFRWPELTADAYQLLKRRGTRAYRLPTLVRASLGWRYEGVLHEYLVSDSPADYVPLDGILINSDRRGARARDPHTYKRDALLLEAGLLDEPDNARYVFYLAQSYRDCEEYDLAIRNYERRAMMGGWPEEVFNALYQAAHCRARRGDPWPEVLAAHLRAHANRPSRAEPLFAIANHYVAEQDHATALVFLERAGRIPLPDADILFIEPEIYDFRIQLLTAVCAHYLRDFERASAINRQLLERDDLPADISRLVKENQRFTLAALGDPAGS